MSDKIKALPPVAVKINWWNSCKLIFMTVLSYVLWIMLLVAGANVLAHYLYSIFTNGFFDSETLKYAVMVAVGSYFCLILDKNKICDALNVKRGVPFITVEQREKRR